MPVVVTAFCTEMCEGMLSVNNDEIRPEVACATPLGGNESSGEYSVFMYSALKD